MHATLGNVDIILVPLSHSGCLLQFYLSLLNPPTAAVPPDTTGQVIAAEGEEPILSCPLKFVECFSQYYMVEWRVPVDIAVARSGSGVTVPWARLNNETLELTIGPIINTTLSRVFECVLLSFDRQTQIPFSNAPKGTVRIIIPCKFCMVFITGVHTILLFCNMLTNAPE